jgi:hypothetical protein
LKVVRLDGHAGGVGEKRNVSVVLVWKPETKRSFGDTGIGIRLMLI